MDVRDLGDVVPVVGLNGSGKSNLLRALNLFFNDELETGERFALRRDFREPGRKAKLRTAVEVDLDFTVFESLRTEYVEALETLSEGARLTLRKEWTLHPVTREEVVTLWAGEEADLLEEVAPENVPYVTRLLHAVRFRYIPNHVHPSNVLREEEDSIRKLLFDRLGKKGILTDVMVKEIAAGAMELMVPISVAMRRATGDIADVQLATPEDWRELAWAFGLKLRASQTQSFEALVHGSGIQSVLAYEVLHALDTSFAGSFGWRKGAVWAVEEPESFLHARLQGELARSFSTYASDHPLQILLSTHSPAFLGAADEGLVVTLDDGGRSEAAKVLRRELLQVAYSSGAVAYAHPLHTGPPKPLLLVEGESDRSLLNRAFDESDLPNPYEILCLHDFDETMQGGDQIAQWLRYHREALEARPEASPVFVLLDWEARPAIITKINASLAGYPTSRCFSWPEDLVNQDLSRNWVGIERFLSTDFVEELPNEIGLDLSVPASGSSVSWKYSVDKKEFLDHKGRIHDLLETQLDPDDIRPLINALPWLSRQLKDAPPLL